MSMLVCTCPNCGLSKEADLDQVAVLCHRCGHRWDLRDEDDDGFDPDPDYGGAFDGFGVSSDADPGL